MAVSPQAQYLAAKRDFTGIGRGPWTVRNPLDQTNDPQLKEVIEAAGLYEGDYAGASARRTTLLLMGALTATRNADGSITYVKAAKFPEPDAPGDWVATANAEIAGRVNQEQARRDREYAAAMAAQDALGASARAAEEREFLRRLDAAGVSPDQIRVMVREAVQEAVQEHTERQFAAHR